MIPFVQPPDVQGMEVLRPLGAGECGRVLLVRDRNGREAVVKVFNPAAINRALLEEATVRLEEHGWPDGVMPEWGADFRGREPLRMMPGLFKGEGETRNSATLQAKLTNFPGQQSWPTVLAILASLTQLHGRQVAHGNLKPGNIFFGAEGEVLLADWALGNMPGVQGLGFTDALLYQPPEQLRNPGGYFREKGYRWDVYAFGVLAYRLLVGTFPRCAPTFEQVAPQPGQPRREGIAADLGMIASMIEAERKITWPDEASDALEKAYREILVSCLSLDPAKRPANAGEVSARFAAAAEVVKGERRTAAALDQGRRAQKRSWRATMASWLLASGVVAISFLWQLNRSQSSTSTERNADRVRDLQGEVSLAKSRQEEAAKAAEDSELQLQREKDTWLARIGRSRAIGDRLFAWAMEKGNRRLPPLDGQDLRLNRLEKYYLEFIEKNGAIPALRGEWALAKLQLAEISLAKSDPAQAEKRLEEAVNVFPDLPKGADTDLRLATDRLLLALLMQDGEKPAARDAFARARVALENVPQAEVDADRVQELLAVLDFHESRLLAAAGQDAEALEKLHRSTEVLNRLALQRPDAMVLRSEMVMCYLSSATILDGIGQMGDARNVRSMAADILLKMITEKPADLDLRLELAGCYGAMAEASILAGDVAGTDANSRAAVKMLEELLRQRPEDPGVRSLLAAQRGIMAGILRDRGDLAGAMKLVDDGILLVEGVAVGKSADPLGKYRLAMLWWQKGKIMGNGGHRKEEVDWEQKALSELRALAESDYGVTRPEELKHSMGYILGDLGHAAQLASNQPVAKAAFSDAVVIWEELNRERPSNEEYEECLTWSRQRLNELR